MHRQPEKHAPLLAIPELLQHALLARLVLRVRLRDRPPRVPILLREAVLDAVVGVLGGDPGPRVAEVALVQGDALAEAFFDDRDEGGGGEERAEDVVRCLEAACEGACVDCRREGSAVEGCEVCPEGVEILGLLDTDLGELRIEPRLRLIPILKRPLMLHLPNQ